MKETRFAYPTWKRVLRLCSIGAFVILATLAIARMSRIEALPAEWIAATAKYVGLIVSSILGIVGTTTDTKDRGNDGRYRLRPVGWIVTGAIGLALIVGALGQYYEDEQQDRREAMQVARLEQLSTLARHSLKRYSGKLEVRLAIEFSMEQPLLLPFAKRFDNAVPEFLASAVGQGDQSFILFTLPETESVRHSIQEELSHIRCFVALNAAVPPDKRGNGLMSIWAMPASADAIEIVEYSRKRRVMKAILRMTLVTVENRGMYSATDFQRRRVTMTVMDMMINKGPARLQSPLVRRSLRGVPLELALYDGELQTLLAYTSLTRFADRHTSWSHPAYFGTTTDVEEGLLGIRRMMIFG